MIPSMCAFANQIIRASSLFYHERYVTTEEYENLILETGGSRHHTYISALPWCHKPALKAVFRNRVIYPMYLSFEVLNFLKVLI